MDNNFNMQPNNMQQPMGQPMGQPMQQPMGQPMQQPMGQPMQQPMGQPMYQQPMGQQMYNPMYQQPKKSNKGLIIGIIAAISVLVIAIVTIVLVLVLGGDKDSKGLIGTWESEDGIVMTFEKDNKGSMSMYGMELPITWEKDGDELEVTMSFMGESETEEMTIVKLTSKTLILADESGEEQEFTKK